MRQEGEIRKLLTEIQESEDYEFQFDDLAIDKAYYLSENEKSSIGIKVLTVFGGLLASLFFLAFIGITGIYDSGIGSVTLGVLFIVVAIWICKSSDRLIIDTICISFFAAGFILFGLGLDRLGVADSLTSVACIFFALMCLFVTQNYILSFVSVLIMSMGFISLILLNNSFNFLHLYISAFSIIMTFWFIEEPKLLTSGKVLARLYDPIRIGLIFSFIGGLILLGVKGIVTISPNFQFWISSIVIVAASMFVISRLLKLLKLMPGRQTILIYVLSSLLLSFTVMSPSISGSMLIVLLCFMVNYKTGFAIGLISFLYFVSQFYFDLNFTLLTKSYMLLGTGLLFLIIYFFTYKKLQSDEKV